MSIAVWQPPKTHSHLMKMSDLAFFPSGILETEWSSGGRENYVNRGLLYRLRSTASANF